MSSSSVAPRHSVLAVALLPLLLHDVSAARTTSAKWAQWRDGTLEVTTSVKRGKSLCVEEKFTISDDTLHFTMQCEGEAYELRVALQHPVHAASVKTRRERANAIATFRKSDASIWWSSLAKHPEKYKKLLEREVNRGDSEPDEDEDPAVQGGSAATPGATRVSLDAEGKPMSQKELDENELTEAMSDAQEEMQPASQVKPQTVARLKALWKKSTAVTDVGVMLASLLIKRGDGVDAVPLLRKVIKLAPRTKGAHQQLALLLQQRKDYASEAILQESVALCKPWRSIESYPPTLAPLLRSHAACPTAP